jgi:hypothetical protein
MASTMMPGGTIASIGLAASMNLNTTVAPFILRGVSLLGIDSGATPMPLRREVWRRLAGDTRPAHLKEMTRTIALEELPLLRRSAERRGQGIASLPPTGGLIRFGSAGISTTIPKHALLADLIPRSSAHASLPDTRVSVREERTARRLAGDIDRSLHRGAFPTSRWCDGFALLSASGSPRIRASAACPHRDSGDEDDATKKARAGWANDFITKTTDGTEILRARQSPAPGRGEAAARRQQAGARSNRHPRPGHGAFTPHYIATKEGAALPHARRHGGRLPF